ncbi:MAG: hypothetical protein PF574_08950 [Candidatus Delongbacteria bacterium]|jgi:hypothetical protein|nr:hypothetical protein [Candidatus Delongbacteria bacterium]
MLKEPLAQVVKLPEYSDPKEAADGDTGAIKVCALEALGAEYSSELSYEYAL